MVTGVSVGGKQADCDSASRMICPLPSFPDRIEDQLHLSTLPPVPGTDTSYPGTPPMLLDRSDEERFF